MPQTVVLRLHHYTVTLGNGLQRPGTPHGP